MKRYLFAVAVLALLAGGCGHATPKAAPTSLTPSVAPAPAPPPRSGSCHRLTFAQAALPTQDARPVSCRGAHTSVTIGVGTVDPIEDGHLMAIDSQHVQAQLAQRCPRRLAAYLGGDRNSLRLSRFETVWFGPSVAQADLGARWFRCDVVALASSGRLATLGSGLHRILDRPGALARYGTCGTSAPSAKGFERVICSQPHRWRAAEVIELPPGTRFLGAAAAATATGQCKDVASNHANGALKYTWSFEWPTKAQWAAGQRYGYCWLPSA